MALSPRTSRPWPTRRGPTRRVASSSLSRPAGFTLIEIMIGLAIFAIGLVAVASIFPAAILLQKQTVHQVEGKHFGRSTRDMVAARGFVLNATQRDNLENRNTANPGSYPGVQRLPDAVLEDANNGWSLLDRSYGVMSNLSTRKVFWVPLIYDADPDADAYDWRVYLFVVRSQRTDTYPTNGDIIANPSSDPDGSVNGTPGVPRVKKDTSPASLEPGVHIGDSVLGTNGVVYPITDDGSGDPSVNYTDGTPDAIWYAASSNEDNNSTFVRLITIIDDAQTANVIREP